ncbi:hypothetical protein D9619_001446 [Psilocybe cf. subviscida]|uniref:Alpha-ketoglutarate-dependent dioxygenase AlkB-like domain-containing protein n=1 Tax=Psilocybe cf. subviscida TaxID=2480587 RepID=A0A8H5F2P1_9AGAR|nr:hypothetical protein D9619_001446 [Psilocybe cf. subviscida]
MKLPRTWDDRTLLEDEPFLNAFSSRAKSRETTKKDHEAWRKRVMYSLQRQKGIDKVVQDWYSLVPPNEKKGTRLRQEEIIHVFFDFYHSLSYEDVKPMSALKQALEKVAQRRAKASAGSPRWTQTVLGQHSVGATIPSKQPSLKAEDPPPCRSVAGASHVDSKPVQQSDTGERATPRRGRVKVEQGVQDYDFLQKSKPIKRRANESLPRVDKKRCMDASFDGIGPQTSKRLRDTKQRTDRKGGPTERLHELHDRKSCLDARPCPLSTAIPEQRALSRQVKRERIEDVPPAHDTGRMETKVLLSKIVSGKKKRSTNDSDDLDDNFDKNFAKRKAITDPRGRTIPSDAPSEPTKKRSRKKNRRTLHKARTQYVKLEEGPATSDLLNTYPISLEATNPQKGTPAVTGDRSTPSPNAAERTEDKALPGSSPPKDTAIWSHRLRNRVPVPPKNSTTSPPTPQLSPKSRCSKPSSAIDPDQREGLNAAALPGTLQPDSNSTSIPTTPMNVRCVLTPTTHPQDETIRPETLAPESGMSILNAGVEAEALERDFHSKTFLSSECSGGTMEKMLDMDIGVTPPAQDLDCDDRTETISEFSSPLRTPADIEPLFEPPLPETRQLDPPVAGGVAPSTDNDIIPFAEREEMKTMTLVSETTMHPVLPGTHISALEPAESSQPLEMKPPLPGLPPIWAESRQEVCEAFDWFRSYQGGVYHVDDYVKGYLLSGFPASRDRFEHGGKFIISHGGGRAESLHSSKGNCISVPASDQLAADKSVRALLNNYLHNRPLALLIDDKYALFPYDLGSKNVAYAVLGFYTIAYAWAEYQTSGNESGRVVRYKFAFRCKAEGGICSHSFYLMEGQSSRQTIYNELTYQNAFRGRIHHIQARTRTSKLEADRIFAEYQAEAASGRMKFRRWPMRAHKCRGALLTNYFSHNAGEPYKYVGGDANTVPFDQAPAVCKARDLIQKRIRDALGLSSSFNEVLSAAYMERQRMAFHSDNEVGLGPLVAGLSLGSPALMHFRIHARHDPQRERKGILLSVVLRHGDVLVMDGAGVQDFYEHTVVPNNFRIAATARQIGATHS